MIIAIVPARGGSKGLPRKNLRCVGGVPLVGRAVRTGVATPEIGSVLISTDDLEIARTAEEHGAEIPFIRPAELARDDSLTVDVVLHMLDWLEKDGRGVPEAVVLLQPTSPLVTSADVSSAIRLYREAGDPVVGVTPNEHPPEWHYRMREGRLEPMYEGVVRRRQESEPSYRLNGAVYVGSPAQIRRNSGYLAAEVRGYVMPAERSVDIDTEVDLRLAELLAVEAQRGAAGAGPGPGA